MDSERTQAQLIANALYEIRLLLSSYVGSRSDAPIDVRIDVAAALGKVAAIDNILQVNDDTRLASAWNPTGNPG